MVRRKEHLAAEHTQLRTIQSRNALVAAWVPELRAMLGSALGRRRMVLLAEKHRVMHDELMSAASYALVMAAETFDPSRGAEFPTWLVWRIRRETLDTLRKEAGLPRSWVSRGCKRVSLDALLRTDEDDANGHGEHAPRDVLIAEAALTERMLDAGALGRQQYAATLLADLPIRETRILCMRFFDGMLMKDIAEAVGLSRGRVSQILKKALKRPEEEEEE